MKRFRPIGLLFAGALLLAPAMAHAQGVAKSIDATVDLAPDGGVTATFAYAFDAGPWAVWKANVGDDPARTRASIRYNFGARVAFDGFKMERDDLNRTAKVTVHSAVGAELRPDGRYAFPVDKEFRLVNNIGRVWFFSANIANTLSTIKVTLPAAATDVKLADEGSSEQALTYQLPRTHGSARRFLFAGWAVLALGILLLGAAWRLGHAAAPAATPPPVA